MSRLVEKVNLPVYGEMYIACVEDVSIEAMQALQEPLKKLYEYEQKEEQGKLLHFHCKIGDEIYKIPSPTNYKLNALNGYSENNRVYEQNVEKIEIFGDGSYVLLTCDGMDGVLSNYFNETWFLTREQAEQKLKELEDLINGNKKI